jgi:hypothetical protein
VLRAVEVGIATTHFGVLPPSRVHQVEKSELTYSVNGIELELGGSFGNLSPPSNNLTARRRVADLTDVTSGDS